MTNSVFLVLAKTLYYGVMPGKINSNISCLNKTEDKFQTLYPQMRLCLLQIVKLFLITCLTTINNINITYSWTQLLSVDAYAVFNQSHSVTQTRVTHSTPTLWLSHKTS